MTQFEHGMPIVPPGELNATKIIATVGFATDTYESVRELIQAGADVIRLNFSHGTHEEHGRHIEHVRAAAESLGVPVAVMLDLQGPKIRLGDFEGDFVVHDGDLVRFGYGKHDPQTGMLPVQYDLTDKVHSDERIILCDGSVHMVVENVEGGIIYARAMNDGVVVKRKAFNLPDTDFGGDIITAKDEVDLAFGASTGQIDYVAQSFIQCAADAERMRELMRYHGMDALLIAKVETGAAVNCLEEIVLAYDAIMVARGDLAVETPFAKVPLIQRELIRLGHKHVKPVIVATQMLLSMTHAPNPTRAEVADIATAVMEGTDAVMLSEETAAGNYPTLTVRTMAEIIRVTEAEAPYRPDGSIPPSEQSRARAIADGISSMALGVGSKVIIAETSSGNTARQISAERSGIPIFAVTDSPRTAQQLALVHDVSSFVRPAGPGAGELFADELQKERIRVQSEPVVIASGQKPGVAGTTDTIKIVY